MNYTILDIVRQTFTEVDENGDPFDVNHITFHLLVKHPKFGKVRLNHLWTNEQGGGMTVEQWLALPGQSQLTALRGILQPHLAKHWRALQEKAREIPAPTPEFPGLIGQEVSTQ